MTLNDGMPEPGTQLLAANEQLVIAARRSEIRFRAYFNASADYLAHAARVLRPELKVLLVTGYAENAGIYDAHTNVDGQIMTKPFSVGALGAKIREMMQN
jgi:hypothetical protein